MPKNTRAWLYNTQKADSLVEFLDEIARRRHIVLPLMLHLGRTGTLLALATNSRARVVVIVVMVAGMMMAETMAATRLISRILSLTVYQLGSGVRMAKGWGDVFVSRTAGAMRWPRESRGGCEC